MAADPALGLSLKLQVDDSTLVADVTRARSKVMAIGAMAPGGAMAGLGIGVGARPDVRRDLDTAMRDAQRAAQDAAERSAKAAAALSERRAMAQIGRETGGITAGEINQRTAAFARMDESLKGVRKRFTDSAQEAGKWLGVIGSVGATAATFYAVGDALREGVIEYLRDGSERAAEFKKNLDLSDVQGSIRAYNDDLAALDAMMSERTAGSIRGWASSMLKSDADLQAEITQKRKDRDALAATDKARRDAQQRDKEKADRIAKEKDAAEAERKAKIDARRKEIEDGKRFAEQAFGVEQDNLINSLDESTRVRAEAAAKRRDLQKQYDALGYKEAIQNEDVFKRAQSAISLERDRQLREIEKRNAETAAKVQQVWSDAYRAIRDESNRAFATDQAQSMGQFAQQLKLEGILASAGMNRIVVEGVG